MNLMDMLSAEQTFASGAASEPYHPLRQHDQPNEPADSVHYLPCIMSALQKDMVEAVVQIFAGLLETHMVMQKQRTTISRLVESAATDKSPLHLDNETLLMYNLLQTISLHPSLLVDHFISKGLLLLSPKDKLLELSGKMLLFTELIDVLTVKQDDGTFAGDYNLLVVARSVKELDLIEGLIVGKKLYYHTLSRSKLFEENVPRGCKEATTDGSPGPDTWNRHHRRCNNAKPVPEPQLLLHLITSDQLYTSYSADHTSELIFSFDPTLDLTSPGLELVRRHNRTSVASAMAHRETPVLIPIQVFSIEHIARILCHPRPLLVNSHDEPAWRLKVLKAFIVNRSHLFIPRAGDASAPSHSRLFQDLGKWLVDWDTTRPPACLDALKSYSDMLVLDIDDDMVISSLKQNHLTALGATFMPVSEKKSHCIFLKSTNEDSIDYSTLKRSLSHFLYERADEVESLTEDGLKCILPELRKSEAARQVEIDSYEDQVGENYRKLRKFNDSLLAVDKKLNRAETENQTLLAQVGETEGLLKQVEDVKANKTEAEIMALTEEQTALVEELEAEKKRLQEEYSAISDESERLREEYQVQSTEAVKMSAKVAAAVEKQQKLEHKLSGPGMSLLPALVQKYEMALQDSKILRVRAESDFISLLFRVHFDRLVKERTLSMEHSASLSGRANNRSSRSSIPFQLN